MLFFYFLPILGVSSVNLLLQTIIDQYLSNSYCLTLVLEDQIDFKFNRTFVYIIPRDDKELTDQLLVVSERGCSDYLVNMRDPQRFLIAFDNVSKIGNMRRSDRKIIFFPHAEDNYKNQTLDLLFTKAIKYIPNILMIIRSEKVNLSCDVYDMFTHSFEGMIDAESSQLIHLNQWDSCTEEFTSNKTLFPHDITNVYGKIVKVASFTYKPYVVLDIDTAIETTGRDGTEVRIVDEFCRWINCTIEIINEDKDKWGQVFENGTGTGTIGSVASDEADMGIGGLYYWYDEYKLVDFSSVTYRSAVTCVAPSPRILTSWKMPLRPFSKFMWYAVITTFALASISLLLARKSSDGVLLTVFGIIIGQSQNSAEWTWRVRGSVGCLMITGLIVTSAYGGGLSSAFTVPNYEPSIDTIQDLVDRNMEWGAPHDAWTFSLVLSNDPLIKKLVSQFQNLPEEELKSRSFGRKLAYGVEKLQAGNVAVGDYLTEEALLDFTLMLEEFYIGHCVVAIRKSSPYTKKISILVGRLQQSGLLLAWENQVTLKYQNFKVQQEVKLSGVKTEIVLTKPLNMHEILGIFIFYAIGIMLSVLLFIAETLTKKFKVYFT